jgi:hypothetical protein
MDNPNDVLELVEELGPAERRFDDRPSRPGHYGAHRLQPGQSASRAAASPGPQAAWMLRRIAQRPGRDAFVDGVRGLSRVHDPEVIEPKVVQSDPHRLRDGGRLIELDLDAVPAPAV